MIVYVEGTLLQQRLKNTGIKTICPAGPGSRAPKSGRLRDLRASGQVQKYGAVDPELCMPKPAVSAEYGIPRTMSGWDKAGCRASCESGMFDLTSCTLRPG